MDFIFDWLVIEEFFFPLEQILVLDEADRILDIGFKKEMNAVISQLPKKRQTLLFSATQTKSVQDLARLSLKDPEYLSVHAEATTATPTRLQQTATVVPLHQKLDLLWSFIKAHLNSRILVFLTSRKQVVVMGYHFCRFLFVLRHIWFLYSNILETGWQTDY